MQQSPVAFEKRVLRSVTATKSLVDAALIADALVYILNVTAI